MLMETFFYSKIGNRVTVKNVNQANDVVLRRQIKRNINLRDIKVAPSVRVDLVQADPLTTLVPDPQGLAVRGRRTQDRATESRSPIETGAHLQSIQELNNMPRIK